MKVITTRRKAPTGADINLELTRRIISACESGVLVRIKYVNLKGIMNDRECYVKSFYRDELFMFVIVGDFGHRSICVERLLEVR